MCVRVVAVLDNDLVNVYEARNVEGLWGIRKRRPCVVEMRLLAMTLSRGSRIASG